MLKTLLSQFWNEEDGASAIEYGLLAALIAVVMAVGATALGSGLSTLFTDVAAQLVITP
jgi:pilus assembly protein Flp/PilA